MKKLTITQINAIKSIKIWHSTYFHGNRKYINGLPIQLFKSIIDKKISRSINNSCPDLFQDFRELLEMSKKNKNTSYFKVLIEGNKHIYYASPNYRHSDYNKSIFAPKNDKTLKLMHIFNSLVNK